MHIGFESTIQGIVVFNVGAMGVVVVGSDPCLTLMEIIDGRAAVVIKLRGARREVVVVVSAENSVRPVE
jgi:hypothetical protein